MRYTTDEYERLEAGYCQIISIESLFCPIENDLLNIFLAHLVNLESSSDARVLKQLPALRKYLENSEKVIHNRIKDTPEEYKHGKNRSKKSLKEFFLENSITGYFIEFCVKINLPFSLDENSTWDGEWFYFPTFDFSKIEQELNNWAERKREEWIRRYTRSNLFSILHAPSLLSVSDYAIIESNFLSALKGLPDENRLFKQVPDLHKIKTSFTNETNKHRTSMDKEFKFLQKIIRTEYLSGFFVELGAMLVNKKRKEQKHITQWVYAPTLDEADNQLTSWVVEWIIKEQKTLKKSLKASLEDK